MRKLRGASSSASSESAEGSGSSSHVQLGLMHLKKLFAEYTHPQQPLTDAEKDDKLYNMLPLFCKVTIKCKISSLFVISSVKVLLSKLSINTICFSYPKKTFLIKITVETALFPIPKHPKTHNIFRKYEAIPTHLK